MALDWEVRRDDPLNVEAMVMMAMMMKSSANRPWRCLVPQLQAPTSNPHAATHWQAAAELVAIERDILSLRAKGADDAAIVAREALRTETAALLERRMSAMEAVSHP